jgi:hypothetical protein
MLKTIVAALLLVVSFAGCRKRYACRCTSVTGQVEYYKINAKTEVKAAELCQPIPLGYPSNFDVQCELE